MKYIKLLIKPTIWHLKPYKINQSISGNELTVIGFLCIDLIITWKGEHRDI
jgi:hypothetical protein